jgi:hypothetical protein
VKVDWWDASEIQPRMRDTPGGRKAAEWLFGNPEADKAELQRVIAVGGELSDAAHAAARVGEVQKFMNRDPHLRYTILSREEDAPETPPAPGTIVSLEAVLGEIRVRFDGSERYPGGAVDAQLGWTLAFSDDADGQQAFEAVQRVTREGGSVELTSGVSTTVGRVPVGLRGLMPEDEVAGTVRITAHGQPQPSRTFPVLVRAGDAELGMVLSDVDPEEGWDVALAGSAGGLQLFMSLRSDEETRDRRMDWRWRLGEGTALEQLLAAEVMRAAHNGAAVQLVTPEDSKVVAELTMNRGPGENEELADIASINSFLQYAAEAEAWLGTPMRPPAQPTDTDARVLSWLVSQIRNPKRDGTFSRMEFTLTTPTARHPQPFQMAAMRAMRGPLFDEEHYLGTEVIHVRQARFEHILRPSSTCAAPQSARQASFAKPTTSGSPAMRTRSASRRWTPSARRLSTRVGRLRDADAADPVGVFRARLHDRRGGCRRGVAAAAAQHATPPEFLWARRARGPAPGGRAGGGLLGGGAGDDGARGPVGGRGGGGAPLADG